MENIRKTIREKELASMLIAAALFILLQYAFLTVMTKAGEAREKEMLELNMNTMMDTASDVTAKSEAAYANLSDNLKADIGMMVNYLKEFADEDGYTGPRVFFDGAVAELRDGQVIFPEGYRCLEKQLTPELVEESLKSGDMLTCKVTVDEDLRRMLADPKIKEYATDADSAYYYLSFGEIAPDFVYVDLLSENEYNAYLERCTQIVRNALESTNRSIGAITLMLQEADGENALISQFGADTAFRSLSSQGLIDRMIREELPAVTLDGQEYDCAYAHLEQGHTTEGPVTCVQMIPKTSLREENRPRVLLMEFIMLVILTAVTVYITASQRSMLERELTDELRTRYSPKRMRKRMVKANILCVVIAFAFVTLAEAVGLTYTELRNGNLFSLCGILLLFCVAYLVNVVCNLLTRLTGGVVSVREETVIRLLHSFMRYVTVIAVMYFGLEYLGFSTGTIIASLGVLSLALSLGAQHLIKDILAGLAIVFDRSFRIGDVVEIGGKEGVVQEIGVRATRLTVSGNNTFYINNSEIRSILNKSNEPSKIMLELRVPANVSLLRIEELLERELPEIGSRNSKIMKGPYLLGVTSLSGGDIRMQRRIIELAVEVVVDQKDGKAVMSYLRREIYLLFQREGIDLA